MKNKELKALDYLYINCLDYGNKDKHYDLIEKALKKLENYEQNEDFNKDVLNYAFLTEQDKIKKLKALEIIKNNFTITKNRQVQHKNLWNLSEEEYDLLKEVLL